MKEREIVEQMGEERSQHTLLNWTLWGIVLSCEGFMIAGNKMLLSFLFSAVNNIWDTIL